jgi:hypothetical protein
MSEDMIAEAFASDVPKVTRRTVEIVGGDDPPDVIALIDGVETGVELTTIMAANTVLPEKEMAEPVELA